MKILEILKSVSRTKAVRVALWVFCCAIFVLMVFSCIVPKYRTQPIDTCWAIVLIPLLYLSLFKVKFRYFVLGLVVMAVLACLSVVDSSSIVVLPLIVVWGILCGFAAKEMCYSTLKNVCFTSSNVILLLLIYGLNLGYNPFIFKVKGYEVHERNRLIYAWNTTTVNKKGKFGYVDSWSGAEILPIRANIVGGKLVYDGNYNSSFNNPYFLSVLYKADKKGKYVGEKRIVHLKQTEEQKNMEDSIVLSARKLYLKLLQNQTGDVISAPDSLFDELENRLMKDNSDILNHVLTRFRMDSLLTKDLYELQYSLLRSLSFENLKYVYVQKNGLFQDNDLEIFSMLTNNYWCGQIEINNNGKRDSILYRNFLSNLENEIDILWKSLCTSFYESGIDRFEDSEPYDCNVISEGIESQIFAVKDSLFNAVHGNYTKNCSIDILEICYHLSILSLSRGYIDLSQCYKIRDSVLSLLEKSLNIIPENILEKNESLNKVIEENNILFNAITTLVKSQDLK